MFNFICRWSVVSAKFRWKCDLFLMGCQGWPYLCVYLGAFSVSCFLIYLPMPLVWQTIWFPSPSSKNWTHKASVLLALLPFDTELALLHSLYVTVRKIICSHKVHRWDFDWDHIEFIGQSWEETTHWQHWVFLSWTWDIASFA